MVNEVERMIAIIGPTAVGKTNLSIQLAKKINTEIISGDSMLVYRGFNIGSAKPSLREQSGVVHHLVDILEPDAEFSVTQFKELASQLITELNAQNKIPILAGGTGLYVKSLVENYQFNHTSGDEEYRNKIETLAELHGRKYVHEMLMKVNPEAAARLHVNDFRRIVRALEVFHLGGEELSQKKNIEGQLAYDTMIIGLTMERSRLYERINQRVNLMVEQGLVEEVESLLKQGVPEDCQAMKGIGYKEIVAYLQGNVSLDFAIDRIKKSTRHFAKRQMTWFRKMPYIHWYAVDEMNEKDLLENVYNELAGKYAIK